MIVPRYWAEGRVQHHGWRKGKRRQVTLRRFGWSDVSVEEAQIMANLRVAEALEQWELGRKVKRREPKVSYNGADGVPIREEIVEERGSAILTRNRYGALCLNIPDLIMIDIDADLWSRPMSGWMKAVVGVKLVVYVWLLFLLFKAMNDVGTGVGLPLLLAVLLSLALELSTPLIGRAFIRLYYGGEKEMILRRLRVWFRRHPEVAATLYETPAGYRLIFTHRLGDPDEKELRLWVRELYADPQYVKMCLKQRGFRARVSPKPWRIGMAPLHHRTAATWPVDAERLAVRQAWVREYEAASVGFAACRFVETLGMGMPLPEAERLRFWHDELSCAGSGLPIA